MSDFPNISPKTAGGSLPEIILTHLADFTYLFDREGRFLYANRPLLTLWGLKLEDVVGKGFHDLQYPDELADRLQGQIKEVVRTGRAVADETPYSSPVTGETEYYEYLFTPVADAEGKVGMVAGSTRVITGRKTAEAALAESNRRHEDILESIKDHAIFTLRADGTVDTWNRGSARIFGYEEKEILGRDGRCLWTPEDRERGIPGKEMRIAREQGRASDERWHLRKDGSRFFATGTLNAIRDATGNLVGYTKICRDVTNQRRADEELLHVRRRLDAALIAGEIGTWVYEVPTDRVFADSNLARLFGVSEADANGGPAAVYFDKVHPDDSERVNSAIARVIESGVEFEETYRLCTADGERTVLARGRVERDSEGRVLRLPGVVLDITERERAEAELETIQERFGLAVEAAELGTFYCPMPLGEIVWNTKCKEHFFLPPEATMDIDRFYELIHPEDRGSVRKAVETAVTTFGRYDIQYRVVSPTDEVRWIHAIGRTFCDVNGHPTRFDGITRDVTPARRLEAEREEALVAERIARNEAERTSHMKDEFLATLSHELRTPLNAILGWTQVLRSHAGAGIDLDRGLDTIERNARAQTRIIEDLLDMSRIISGKVRLDVQVLDLESVLEAAIQTISPAAEAKGIRIRSTLGPTEGAVNGDPDRLQQVFWNLLSNAVKFTPKGGSITITLRRVDSHLRAEITDSGEGLTADFLPFVFDRFRQHDASTTRHHGGLGLGLAIVRQLVELHGGTVDVSSAGAGQGSTFTVCLPTAIVQRQLSRARTDEVRPTESQLLRGQTWNLSGLNILVVDDEPEGRRMVRYLLEGCGAVVTEASDTKEGFQALLSSPPDVLISDIGMPGEDGYSFIRRIRELGLENGGATPAIALTAYARMEDRMRAIINGFQMHLSKPVESAELLTMIASLTNRTSLLEAKPS